MAKDKEKDKEKESKVPTVFDLAAKYCKEFKDKNMAIKASIVPKYEKFATGSFGIDYPLFGGWPEGRIITISGPEHSGKTTLAYNAIAAYQKKHPDKKCVFIDVEHSSDLEHQAKMNHLDLENLLFIDPPAELAGETIMDMVRELQDAPDIGIIAIDSIPAMLPKVVIENSLEEDKGMRATLAKKYYPFLAMMSGKVREKKNNLILINQIREVAGQMPGTTKYVEPGGKAPAYMASVRVRCGSRTLTKDDDINYTKDDGLDSDGFRLKFKIIKNKCDPINRAGGFITYRLNTGADTLFDFFEIATKFDFVLKSGGWITLIDPKTAEALYYPNQVDEKGNKIIMKDYKKNLMAYLRDNPEFANNYIKMLTDYIANDNRTGGKLLDDEDLNEITQQEEAVKKSFEAEETTKEELAYIKQAEENAEAPATGE